MTPTELETLLVDMAARLKRVEAKLDQQGPTPTNIEEVILDLDANGAASLQNVNHFKEELSKSADPKEAKFSEWIPGRFMLEDALDHATNEHQETQIERNISNAVANMGFRGFDRDYFETSNLYSKEWILGPYRPGALLEGVLSAPGTNNIPGKPYEGVSKDEILPNLKNWLNRYKTNATVPPWVLNPKVPGQVD